MFLPVAIVYRNGNRILRDQYSYLRNDVLVICALKILKTDFVRKIYCSTVISKSQQKLALILNEC